MTAATETREQPMLVPKVVQIETVATACTARCIMCPIDSWTRPAEIMKLELFSRILDQLAPHRDEIAHIALNGFGEPLLDKKIGDKIALAGQRGFHNVQLSTNGTELREKLGRSVLDAGLERLIVSIDGATRQTHEAIRQRTDWAEIVANTRRFIEMRDAGGYGTKIWVRMIRQPLNDHEWAAYEAYWSGILDPARGDRVVYFQAHNWSREAMSGVAEPGPEPFTWCEDLWRRLVIHASGAIALCCVDDDGWFEIGNVREGDAIETLNRSPIFNRYRALMADGRVKELEHCRHCSIPQARGQTNYRRDWLGE